MIDVGTAIGYLELDTSKFTSGLSTAAQDLRNFMDSSNSTSDRLASLGSAFTTVGGDMTKNVTLPLAGLGAAVVKAGSDYEAGMSKVQAISGATEEELGLLGDKALEMASKTKFSTGEAAEAYSYMAMAGWKTEQMVGGLSGIMNLAAASGEDLATTSDIVTDAMTAFGLSADGTSKVLKDGVLVEVDNTSRFVDVLAAASNNANTNVSMLGDSFKYVAPVARALGYSVEDTSIALGLMANSGIKASSAGTTLRTVITNMANPTDKMSTAMDLLGVSLEDDEGNMYSLMEVMNQLREGFGGGTMSSEKFGAQLNELNTALNDGTITQEEYDASLEQLTTEMYGVEGAQKAQLAAMLAGKEGMSGLLAIVSASDEDFNKLSEAIYNSNGTCEEMANIMNDNLQGAITMLGSALNVLATSLSQYLIPAFTDLIRWITDVVNSFNSLDDGTKKIIVTIAAVAAAVGPVLLIIGKVITVVSQIGSAISTVIGVVQNCGTAISGLFSILAANPIAAVIAIVAALVAGLIVLWNTNEDFRNAVKEIWDAITEAFKTAWEAIQAAWEGAIEFFAGVWEGISNAFSAVVEFFSGIFSAAWEVIQAIWAGVVEFFSGIWEGIQAVWSGVVEFFSTLFSAAWEAIQAIWQGVIEFFQAVWEGIQEIWSGVVEFFSAVFSAAAEAVQVVWQGVVEFFQEVWEGIQTVFSVVAEVLGAFFQAAVEAIQAAWSGVVEFFSGIWEAIKTVFSTVAEVLGGFFKAAWEAVKAAWEGAKEFFQGVWEGIKVIFSVVADVLGGFFKAAWEAVKSTWEAAKEFFQGIWDTIRGIFEQAESVLGGFFKAAWEAVKSAWEAAESFFTGLWDKIKSTAEAAGTAIGDALKKAWEAVKSAWEGAVEFFSGIKEKIVNVFSNIGDKFKEIGTKIVEGIKNGVMGAWSAFTGWVSEKVGSVVSTVTGAFSSKKAKGSYASGLDYVPQDGLYQLHEGERILTKDENRRDSNSGGDTYNFYSPTALDARTAAREMKRAKQELLMGYI